LQGVKDERTVVAVGADVVAVRVEALIHSAVDARSAGASSKGWRRAPNWKRTQEEVISS
jgi:hypothetical protein